MISLRGGMRPISHAEVGILYMNEKDAGEEQPKVPKGVLRGIEDIAEGRTMSEEDLNQVLKWEVE